MISGRRRVLCGYYKIYIHVIKYHSWLKSSFLRLLIVVIVFTPTLYWYWTAVRLNKEIILWPIWWCLIIQNIICYDYIHFQNLVYFEIHTTFCADWYSGYSEKTIGWNLHKIDTRTVQRWRWFVSCVTTIQQRWCWLISCILKWCWSSGTCGASSALSLRFPPLSLT